MGFQSKGETVAFGRRHSFKLLGTLRGYPRDHFRGPMGSPSHSPWGHMGSPSIPSTVRHIGTETMRMNKLGQTVTAAVDACVVRKNQSR